MPSSSEFSTPPGVDPESKTWPVVMAFAVEMERKLSLNRHKGDREGRPYDDDPDVIFGGWLHDEPSSLHWRVLQELDELRQAIAQGTPFEDVAAEAADVANMAMMMADAYGWKRERRGFLERRP